ncbi:DUF4157 domain-containing protein [Mucilaginibacter sp. OK098]|uniref:eCIS core domain-containing protein n=1 Tax=Mucilaginibacter sp. OK098 TaxID=1855297 RepID=UPI00091D5873|nr:DUF4157 domain-containing protein [Mucilaginibacter sp. OK098]SHN27356.1 Putative peptidoglycan binding domain-containing protein [Mucilaginibacter sp. OK098]
MHENTQIAYQPQATPAALDNMNVPVPELSDLEPGLNQRFPIQLKLSVGAVNDPLEHEADAMADKVMRMPETSFIQRKAGCSCSDYDDEHVRLKPLAGQITPFIQAKSDGYGTVSDAVSSQIKSSMGGGNPIQPDTKSFMESRFGANFSDIKIHNGGESTELNRSLDAKAFTVSNNIYFNSGQYQPETDSGKHLLAHELTHTIQQKKTPVAQSIQRMSPRFDQNDSLVLVSAGKRTLQIGSSGRAVSIIQQALVDAGFLLPKFGIDGSFGSEMADAIKKFQSSQSLTETGILDKKTFDALDALHQTHQPAADRAGEFDPLDPGAGTRKISSNEAKDFDAAINTEPHTKRGGLPTFKPLPLTVGGLSYEDEVRASLTATVDDAFAEAKKDEALRLDPVNIESWSRIKDVAHLSKVNTDKVFGAYKKGAEFTPGTNLVDLFESEGDHMAKDATYADDMAIDVLDAFLGYEPIKKINKAHGAVTSRAAENAILLKIKQGFLDTRKTDLFSIQKDWPGQAGGGVVQLQRYKGANNAENRTKMWDLFETCIHEYIHTLEAPAHVTYRNTKFAGDAGEHRGNRTLREGVTDYFTGMVWDTLTFDEPLRSAVEGPYHEAKVKHQIAPRSKYDETDNAERAAGIVGVKNLMAAFFSGRVDLIGG